MPELEKKPRCCAKPQAWNLLSVSILLTGLFGFFTNGIPFLQWGLLKYQNTKGISIYWMRYSVLVMFVPFLIWFWRWPVSFQNLWLVRKANALSSRAWIGLLIFLFIGYTTALSAVGFLRHWTLETRAFDLGIFVQAVWNTLQGDFLYSSLKGGINYLGDHMSPLLAALAPFYRLWPTPENLILIQAAAAASCLFPIAYLAYQKTQHRLIALLFALMYVVYLPTRSALHEDFHPEVLAECFLLLAFIFLEKKKTILFLFSLLVAVSAKENMLGIAFVMGFYAAVWRGQKKLGLALMIGSVALFFFVTRWAIPHLSGRPYLYDGNYRHLLQGFPLSLMRHLLQPDLLEYCLKVFLPFLFLPFFHLPAFILILPVLVQNLLSDNEAMHSFSYHYTIGMTPFVFVAAIYGFSELCRRFAWFEKRKVFFSFCLILAALLRSGPSEYFYYTDIASHRTAHRDMIRQQLKEIPAGVSVLTHNNLISQVIHRKEIHQFDYLYYPTKAELALAKKADYVILEQSFWEGGTKPIGECVTELQNVGYQTVYEKDGFYILRMPETETIL